MWLHAVCLWQAHWVQLQKDAIRNSVQGVRHSVPLGKPLVMRIGLPRSLCVPRGDDDFKVVDKFVKFVII